MLISRNRPDSAVRLFAACEHHGLAIVGGSFTSGSSPIPSAAAWGVDLFLSKDEVDVLDALSLGIAAAVLSGAVRSPNDSPKNALHIALDGDSVIFGSEPDQIFEREGLAAFERYERDNVRIPIAPGPFGRTFIRKLAMIREICRMRSGGSPVRISLVTARNAPAHERALRTLREWNVALDEAHFVGNNVKTSFLCAAGAHCFFDDREKYISSAHMVVTAGWVPRRQRTPNATAAGTDGWR